MQPYNVNIPLAVRMKKHFMVSCNVSTSNPRVHKLSSKIYHIISLKWGGMNTFSIQQIIGLEYSYQITNTTTVATYFLP